MWTYEGRRVEALLGFISKDRKIFDWRLDVENTFENEVSLGF